MLAASWSAIAMQGAVADRKAPVREEEWMNYRMGSDAMLHSGQQLDPEGTVVEVPGGGRLLALEFARGGRVLLAKTTHALVSLDPGSLQVLHKVDYPLSPLIKGGGSMHGLAVSADGVSVLVSGGRTHLYRATVSEQGRLDWGESIDVSGGATNANPLGVAITPDGQRAVVALSVENAVAVVELASGKVLQRIKVGVCPYGVALAGDGRTAFVSNFGGSLPQPGEKTFKSAKSDVAVDARAIPLRGTLSVVDLSSSPREIAQVEVGLHPTEVLLSSDGGTLFVANMGSDSVSVVDTAAQKVVRTLSTKPEPGLPWGTLTDGLALSEDGSTLYTANAGVNAIGCHDLDHPHAPMRLIPSGWYPGAVRVAGGTFYVANVRQGVQRGALPRHAGEAHLLDVRARKSAHLAHALRSAALGTATGAVPVPVPARVGEPSVLKHVVYVIKENRTFDQVLGDLGRGNCEPKLCNFPRPITPNHHALAERFPLLDNYYCNGVNSSDGHAWGMQGIVTPYREKDRPGFRCAYDFGSDALFFAGCGFLWDHALLHGKSFRNYGEMDRTTKVRGETYADFFEDRRTRARKTAFAVSYAIPALKQYSCPGYPGWEMSIPDQTRADIFLGELAEFEHKGTFPDLSVVYLPNDHTAKELTANAYLADNDLALGRIIEGLSKSRFWKDMVVFVNEDDPQAGQDHVDGHRSLCFVASPWAKRGEIVSRFYNQTSVLHTICRILGIPPMNQLVAASPTMEDCFGGHPDETPYQCLIPEQPLNEPRMQAEARPRRFFWPPWPSAEERLDTRFAALDFSAPDLIDEDTLNRAIWAQTKPGVPYPKKWAGAHGRGLARLGLKLDSTMDDND